MTFLPIVERELRVAARLPATYRNRILVVGIFAFVAMIIFLFGAISSNPGQVGSFMFWMLAYIVLALCLFEGVRKTADCLSEEKREGTLGLLFLTDLRSYDIILGKLAGMSLNSIYGLLSLLPLLALPLLLGGIMLGEFWRVALALANILFLSLCVGIWVSSLCRAERHAMGGTLAAIAAICALPFLARATASLSPLCAFHSASAGVYARAASGYWNSILITQAMCWAFLLWACLALPGSWHDEELHETKARWWNFWERRTASDPARRGTARERMLRTNPAYWLAGRNDGRRLLISILMAVASFAAVAFILRSNLDGLPWFLVTMLIINFLLKIRIAIQATHCLAEARRNSALEMLLVTPLSVEQIIRGQLLALKRAYFAPVLGIFAVEITGVLGGLFSASYGKGEDGWMLVAVGGAAMAYIALVVVDIYAVIWAGMWYGLSARKEGLAAIKTILYVLVLPPCCLILLCWGLPFAIGIPIFWIGWGSQNLRREFRRYASQRYVSTASVPAWTPVAENRGNLPPVL